jgi:hypothetical protein
MAEKRAPALMVHQLRLLPFGGSELVAAKPNRARQSRRGGGEEVGGALQAEVAEFIRRWTEVPVPRLVADEAARLSPETFAELRRLGLLVPESLAKAVGCEACDLGHAEWVETVAGPDGASRFYIECPEKGRVEVSGRRLQNWAVDFNALARALRDGLGAVGPVEPVQGGRLWRLGRAVLAKRPRELWLVREVPGGRGREPARSIPAQGSTLIFVLGWPPSTGWLARPSEELFDVRKVLSVRPAGFHVDRGAVEKRLRSQAGAEASGAVQLLCCCG